MDIKKILLTVISVSLKMLCLVIAVMGLYIASTRAFSFGEGLFNERAVAQEPGTDIRVTVTDDMEIGELTDTLYDRGLIDDKLTFRVKAVLYQLQKNLVPGTYTLNTSMTISDMIDIITTEAESSSAADGE